MTLALTKIDLDSGKIAMCRDLDVFPESTSWRVAVISECIRQYLHGRTRQIHSAAITGALRRCLEPYLDAIGSEESVAPVVLIDCLNELANCGDVYRGSGGYWKPCPIRLISLPRSQELLVLGGAPTAYLRQQFSYRPKSFGRARIIGRVEVPESVLGAYENRQNFLDWLGGSTIDMQHWAYGELQRAEAHLEEGILEGAEDMEAYLPDKDCVRTYRRRWVRLTEAVEHCNVPRLCRAALFKHGKGKEFFVVKIDQSDPTGPKFQSVRIERDTAIRLRYGLDLSAGNPLSASWVNVNPEEFVIELFRPWPQAEARVLSLGDKLPSSKNGASHEYLFSNRLASLVQFVLNRLGMEVRTK